MGWGSSSDSIEFQILLSLSAAFRMSVPSRTGSGFCASRMTVSVSCERSRKTWLVESTLPTNTAAVWDREKS